MRIALQSMMVVLALSAGGAVLPAWAAGGGGGSGGGTEAEAPQQDPDYRAGLAAAKAKDWARVVSHMTAVTQRDPKHADAWNELGHAHRQLGDLDNAFKDYARALEIDPKHKGAHEYLGEAYLLAGKLELAEQELQALDRICFFSCEPYRDLKAQIARYKRDHPKTASLP